MPGLFDGFNLRVKKTPESTVDLRLLDVSCNHNIVDESVVFDRNTLFSQISYSSGPSFSSMGVYSGYNNNNYVYVNTKLPYVDNGNIAFYESPQSSFDFPLTEPLLTLPSGTDQFPVTYRLTYPPRPNSLSIKQLITTSETNCGIDDVQTIKIPFTNYTLAQLDGILTFSNINDASYYDKDGIYRPTILEITYVADQKYIPPLTKECWSF